MQLTAFQIINAMNGQTASAVFSTASRIGFTISAFDVEYDMDGQEIPKFQSAGQWENFEYVRRMLINQQGKIVGSSNADYNWQRRALMLAALPDQGTLPTTTHAELYPTPAGHPQLYAQCVLSSVSLPTTFEDSQAQPYQLQWRNNYGYWRLASDKTTVYKI